MTWLVFGFVATAFLAVFLFFVFAGDWVFGKIRRRATLRRLRDRGLL